MVETHLVGSDDFPEAKDSGNLLFAKIDGKSSLLETLYEKFGKFSFGRRDCIQSPCDFFFSWQDYLLQLGVLR